MRCDREDNIQEFSGELDRVLKEAHGKSIVLVMGANNSGKNTFVNQLLGVRYSVQMHPRTRQDYFAISGDDQAIALKKIGPIHNYMPELFNDMPELFNAEQEEITYCVCPDLVNIEARDYEKEKLKVSLPMTLQVAAGIKSLVFLFNIKTLQNSRGVEFRRLVASFVKLFKNEDFIYSNRDDMPSVFYVFTKVEREVNIENIKVTMLELLSTIDLEVCELERLMSELVSAQNEADDKFIYAQKIIDNNIARMVKEAEKRMILAVVNDINRIFICYDDANIHNELQVLKSKLIISPVVHSSKLLNSIDIRDTFLNKHVENMIKLKNDWDRYHSELKMLHETKELNEAIKLMGEGTLQNKQQYLNMLSAKKADNRIERQRLVEDCKILDTDEEVECRRMVETVERASFNQAILNISMYLIRMGIEMSAIGVSQQLPLEQTSGDGLQAQDYVANAVSDFVLKNLPIQVKLFEYDGSPFCRIVRSTTDGTQFNRDEVSIPDQGKYSISYSPLIDGTAIVTVYVYKKILYSSEINTIKDRIDSLDIMYETYTKEMHSIASDPQFRHDANEISAVLRKCTGDIVDVENKICNMKLQNADYVKYVHRLGRVCECVPQLSRLLEYSEIAATSFGVSIDEVDRTLDETMESTTIFRRR